MTWEIVVKVAVEICVVVICCVVVGAVKVWVSMFVDASWVETIVVGAVCVKVAVFVDAGCVEIKVEMIVVGAV